MPIKLKALLIGLPIAMALQIFVVIVTILSGVNVNTNFLIATGVVFGVVVYLQVFKHLELSLRE